MAKKLLDVAVQAREHAYAPYSGDFKVGSSVLTEDGTIFSGCNIENASFGATVCAERVAVFKALSSGHRRICAVAVVADTPDPVQPCGICLQVISEFGSDAAIVMANCHGLMTVSKTGKLLRKTFKYPTRTEEPPA